MEFTDSISGIIQSTFSSDSKLIALSNGYRIMVFYIFYLKKK